MNARGSNSLTSAAIWTGRFEASNRVIRPTPETPAVRLRQKSETLLPIGVTAPSPVTTTRSLSVIAFHPMEHNRFCHPELARDLLTLPVRRVDPSRARDD